MRFGLQGVLPDSLALWHRLLAAGKSLPAVTAPD